MIERAKHEVRMSDREKEKARDKETNLGICLWREIKRQRDKCSPEHQTKTSQSPPFVDGFTSSAIARVLHGVQ